MFDKITHATPDKSIFLIRLMVGSVFFFEGLQKYIYPAIRGVGRFEGIGLPAPEFLAYFVGAFEIICGIMIVMGLLTRLAVIPTMIIMLVAIITTKIPVLLGESFWGLALRDVPYYGFLGMFHETRTDLAMLIGSIFLFITGSGGWSLDLLLFAKRDKSA